MSETAKKGWYSLQNATLGFINRPTINGYEKSEILNLNKAEVSKANLDEVALALLPKFEFNIDYNKAWAEKKNLFGHTYLPYYTNILGLDQVLICVIQKRFGKIGDIIKITYSFEGANGDIKEYSLVAIIGESIENITTSDARVGIGNIDGKECVAGLIVNVDSGGFSWLNSVRETFFGEGDKYKTCTITSIEHLKSFNDIGDTSPETLPEEDTHTATDFLLKPSDDERKYGINIYEAVQQLIRFSTSAGVAGSGGGNALIALRKYSEFLYYLLNSQVLTGNYLLSSMPWLRPGFNVWVDPLYSDTVYYLQEVQHQGDPINGASTSVSLVFGRPRSAYVNDADAFGSIKSANDNVFVNTINSDQKISGANGDGPWGKYIASNEDFKTIKAATEEYYSHKIEGTTNANESNYHKELYVNGRKSAPVSKNVDSAKIFNGEYTASEIQAKMDAIYANAPQVVKDRVSKLENVVSAARNYIELHYDKEKKV